MSSFVVGGYFPLRLKLMTLLLPNKEKYFKPFTQTFSKSSFDPMLLPFFMFLDRLVFAENLKKKVISFYLMISPIERTIYP